MSVFTVDLANQPGELARLCEAMAGHGINLVLSAIAPGLGGTVAFIADDEGGAREVLDGAGLRYAMRPALTIRMRTQTGPARPRSASWPTRASTPTCSCRSASLMRCSSP